MELRPFVAVTCQGCSFQQDWGVWQDLACIAAARTPPPHPHPFIYLFFSVVFLGFNICRVLISEAEGAGMRGMQASGLPVYSEGFLSTPPPHLPGFLSRIFHIFAPVVLGTGHGPGAREPPVAFLNSFLQHFHTHLWGFGFFLLPQNSTVSFN